MTFRRRIGTWLVLALVGLLIMEARGYVMARMGYAVTFVPDIGNRRAPQTFITHPWATYDVTRGFRLRSGDNRILRTFNHETIFDSRYFVNAAGFITRLPFTPGKQPGFFRIAVLGDSYTAAEYLTRTWPDVANEILAPQKIEIYSFAQDPSTPASWYQLFTKEILPNYDFDALMLVSLRLDFGQGIFVADTHKDEVRIIHLPELPASREELLAKYFYSMWPIMKVVDETRFSGWNRLKDRFQPIPWDFYFSRFLWEKGSQALGRFVPMARAATPESTENGPFTFWSDSFDPKHGAQLKEMVAGVRSAGKPVVFVTIPKKEEVLSVNRGEKPEPFHSAVEKLAPSLGATYLSPFPAFAGMSEAEVTASWLRYDEHWGQPGSDKFARYIASWISQAGFTATRDLSAKD